MAKNMARLVDGVVVNLEWCSDSEPETAELREYEGYAIRIGDSWEDGKWMRDGAAVLTEAQIAAQVAEERAAAAAAQEAQAEQEKEASE
nr:MAG TPA: hypothetical protein [Caudoviricetes sp.]